MRKMRSFLGCLVSLIIIVFSANALAEGYSCPSQKQYTTCNSGYYLTSNQAGNSCSSCSSASNNKTQQSCKVSCTDKLTSLHAKSASATDGTQTCNGNYQTSDGGSKVGADAACTGCSSWGACTNGGTCYATSCATGYYYSISSGHGTCTSCTTVSNKNIVNTQQITHGTRKQTCTGTYQETGAGDTNGSDACTGCTASTYTCECDSGYHSSGSGESCTCEIDTIDCSKGQYYYGSTRSCTACLNGYYCTGGRYTDNGQTQGLVQCPQDATGTSGDKSALGQCYKACPTISVPNSKSVSPTSINVSPKNSSEWNDCTYNVTCNDGYKPSGDGGTSPSCTTCGTNKYCSGNTENSCPADYPTSSSGASSQSDCYRSCNSSDIPNSATVTGSVHHPGTDKSQCTVSTCASGYFITDSNKKTCTQCPAHSTGCDSTDVGSSGWDCDTGYTKQGNQCVADSNTWHVEYNYNCNSTYSETCDIVYFGPESDNVKIDCTPTCTGYTFTGWYTLVSNGTKVTCVTGKTSSNYSCYSWQSNLTVYAYWTADTLSCSAGQYYNHTTKKCTQCPANSYCPGTNYTLDDTTDKGLNNCPSGYTKSDVGNSSEDNCYRDCTTGDVTGSTAVSGRYNKNGTNTCVATTCDGTHYKDNNQCKSCPSNAENCGGGDNTWTCKDGYTKQNGDCVADSTKWKVTYNYNCDPSHTESCSYVYFGPESDNVQITCQPTCQGYTFQGWYTLLNDGRKVTCVTGRSDGGSHSCEKSQSDLMVYAHWTKATEACQSGKYYDGSTHKNCNQKGTDYYCSGSGTATVGQEGCYTQCPANFRSGVDSPYSAATNCYHTCEQKTDNNAKSVTAQQNKINYPGNDMSPNCTYTVDCNVGYKPQNQNTATASCTKCDSSEYCPGGTTDPDPCPDGYTCSGGEKEECPANSYCTGGESHTCPDGGKTDGTGKSSITDCYKECPDKQTTDIPHSTSVTKVNDKVHYSGSSYPACTYNVECDNRGDIKYKPFGNGTSNPTCVWDNGSGCPAGYYCPPGQDPQQCPNGGYADAGATQITDCHKEVDPYTDWEHGTGSATCYYNTESQDYNSRCDNGKAKTCEAGYYYGTQGSLACQSVGNGYYSPENDTDRKECPTGYSGSSENASSYTDCYKNCTLSVPNSSTVTPKQPRVNADSASSYPQCTFTVVCNTGYTVQNNDTANPTCDANKFTVTLDKNGGSGSVSDNVQCTIGQNCNLPDASSLTRAGYTNDNKWCTTNSGGTPCYNGGSSVAASTLSAGGTDITLYAKWTPNIYTVNLDDQNSDDPHATASVPHTVYLKFATGWFNEKAATTTIEKLTTLPTKNGYTFSGFSTQKSGGTQVINNTGNFDKGQSALTSITSDNATIYAQWANGTTTCPEGTYYDGTPECKSCPEGYYCTGGDYGTGGGEQGKNECPDNGTAPANSTSETQCYKTVDYTATHGSGTQTCNYNSESHQYDKDCKDKKIEKCNGGYYLSSTDKIDCDEAGMNYYSGENEKERHQCPNESKTKGTTESSITACYKNVPYEATYGSGTQDCFYTSGNDSNAVFATSCENKRIDKCWAGYYRLTETDEDCTIAAQNYYSEKDDVEQHPCPDNGTTESEGTTSQTLCRLDNLPYNKENGKCEHCDGHQRCYYNPQDKKYTNNCNTPTIEQCDAGYWFNESQKTSDCVEAGIGYWSPEEDLTRHQCEVPGTTDSKTSTSASDCYNPNTVCDVENGTGKHKCNWGTNAYDVSCTACVVTSCNMGYSQSGDKCEECPEGYFCGGGETGEDGGKEKCPSDYPNTSAGASSKNDCYKNCTMGANATEMSGGVYYDGQNTCKITKCNKGYTLQNGVCVLCPAGSFCDGTGGGDGGETGDVKSCADLGNAYDNPLTKWQYAEQGADEATDCYAKCENYTVGYGTAIADNPTVHYPTQCTYHGESETGNPCELVGEGENAQCVEKSCKGNFEMIDGKCTLCKREHALSYRAEGNCLIASCEAGYHSAETSCVEDVVECEAPNATSAEQTWDRQTRAFSKCTIKVCDEGYHLASNACVPNEQTCTLDHGHGYMEWDIKKNAWGDCIATHCDPGYTNDPSMNYEPNKQCGHCKNKFAQLGELAVDGYKKGEQVVSSYTTECEIAACMYQGELYDLQGNECIPICTPYTDATGTRKRVGNECERTCNDGYMSW